MRAGYTFAVSVSVKIYLDANLQMKEQALAKAGGPKARPDRFRPDDRLLAFLKRL